MEACPFCSTQIDEDVVIYGGTCPSCFAHIPGEEAATDPGEDVKTAQAESDRKRAKRRALAPLLLAVPVVALVGIGALYLALRPAPELAVLDFDDGGMYTADLDGLLVAEVDTGKADGVADAAGASGKTDRTETRTAADKRRRVGRDAAVIPAPKIGSSSAEDDAALLAQLGTDKAEDVARKVRGGSDLAPAGLADDLDIAGGMSTSSVGGAGFKMDAGSIAQTGAPLDDPQKIAYMVQRVLRKQLPRLKNCYESSLRANSALQGAWTLTFTVETDGSAGKVKVIGRDMTDDSLEQCLKRRVSGWRFSRIVKPQPVKKTVEFKR